MRDMDEAAMDLAPGNLAFVEELYYAWVRDPGSVAEGWRRLFQGMPATAAPPPAFAHSIFAARDGHVRRAAPASALLQERVHRMVEAYRQHGHLAASLDPLGLVERSSEKLALESFGLGGADLDTVVSTEGVAGPDTATVSELRPLLSETYCRNIGVELGATTTVFPSDGGVRRFLAAQGREKDWAELAADPDATYDLQDEIDLSRLEPLIAMPSSPGNVRPVREVAGQEIHQAYIGSSANPGYRDFAVPAQMVNGRRVHDWVSFDVNPTSRQILETLVHDSHFAALIHAGARIHQAGCNGCIGMGQAPATKKLSLRTVPRNFPGRSGTLDDKVCLVSPETATASALTGVITDPRTLSMPYPRVLDPDTPILNTQMLVPPPAPEEAREVVLEKGPNIASLPRLEPLPDRIEVPVLLKVGDDISTDEILPAGARVLPFRSNTPKIAEFAFDIVDRTYFKRAVQAREHGGHVVVGGKNYGHSSKRTWLSSRWAPSRIRRWCTSEAPMACSPASTGPGGPSRRATRACRSTGSASSRRPAGT